MRNLFGKILIAVALLAFDQVDLSAQHLHYSTLSGYCEDAEENEAKACEPPPCNCPQRRCHWWERDQFAEDQYESSGWPGRREDELDEWLTR